MEKQIVVPVRSRTMYMVYTSTNVMNVACVRNCLDDEQAAENEAKGTDQARNACLHEWQSEGH